MKIKKMCILEPGDAEVALRDYGPNPCTSCKEGYGCLGCPAQREWEASRKKAKDAGVLEHADMYAELLQGYTKLVGVRREVCQLMKDLQACGYSVEEIDAAVKRDMGTAIDQA